MASGADDIVGHFRLAYQTVIRFPVLIVPPLAVAVLGFLLVFFIGGGAAAVGALMGGAMGGGQGATAGGIVGLILGMLVFGLVMSVLWLLSAGMVVVMARDALGGREPVQGEAFSAVVGRLGAVVVASGLVTAIMAVGFLFLVIPGLVAAVFLMFTLPAVLLDRLGALDGIRRSFAVVRGTSGPSSAWWGVAARPRRRRHRLVDPVARAVPRGTGRIRAPRRRGELPHGRRRPLLPAAPDAMRDGIAR